MKWRAGQLSGTAPKSRLPLQAGSQLPHLIGRRPAEEHQDLAHRRYPGTAVAPQGVHTLDMTHGLNGEQVGSRLACQAWQTSCKRT